MPSNSESDTTETPPRLMSRSESLGRPPATKAWARTTDRTRPRGEVGAHASHRLGQRRLMGAHREAPRLAEGLRVEVGDRVHGHRAVLVVEQHRRADPGGVGAHVDAGGVDEPGAEAQALRGVVVARGDDDPGS